MNTSLVTRIVAAAAFVAAIVPTSPSTVAAKGRSSNAVLGVIDTGINPYHAVFRDESPQAYKDPSTYIPDYPADAIPLKLSLNEDKYWDAVAKDCDRVWSKIETGKLYWFPGTKIVGAIAFAPKEPINCDVPKPVAVGRILDSNGHGTMTASRATSTEYGACRECRVVSIQYGNNGLRAKDALDSIDWAAKNAQWIDAQSNSWGPVTPLWEPTGASQLMGSNPQLVRKVEEVSRAHLAFWASGNGAAFRWGVLGHPTLLSTHLTPSAIMVGGHDSGYVSTWPGFPPHIVADACASWAAYYDQLDKSAEDVGSGTSAATPYAAGGAVEILLEARRILGDPGTGVHGKVVAQGKPDLVAKGPLADGKLTLDEWKRILFATATPRPAGQKEDGPPCGATWAPYQATPIKWTDVPDGYPEYLQIGYGAVDDESLKLALQVLSGKSELPDRSETDQYFDLDRSIRETTYGVWSKP